MGDRASSSGSSRNPNYWGTQGAADEVVIQFFKSADTMVQALKSGELDYALGVNADQFDSLKGSRTSSPSTASTNGWTMLNLNSYDKDIPGGGASTKALRDPAFRDALGYAIDKELLIERVLGGYGTPGTTQVPPFPAKWHVEPDKPRTFDIELAKQKLDAAGYPLDASGQRLDKEGKPISLRLYMPTDLPNYPKSAPFIKEWFGELGIKVVTAIYRRGDAHRTGAAARGGGRLHGRLGHDHLGLDGLCRPEPAPPDLHHRPDRRPRATASSRTRTTTSSSRSRRTRPTDAERHELMAQMQNIFYDDAPYHILYYEDTLVAYRTDKFGGWQNQPANGVPLFGYGSARLHAADARRGADAGTERGEHGGPPGTSLDADRLAGTRRLEHQWRRQHAADHRGGRDRRPRAGRPDRMAASWPGCGRGRGRLTARTLRAIRP